jgi:Zinc finger found in FPG and IleRS
MGLEIKVEKADGQKCPRCWNYHTVRGNPQELCDRCISAILEGLPYWVENGTFTQEQADEFRAEVKTMVNRWKA